MSRSNYELEIISNHPEFKNKSLRKYYVEGVETVGAWGNEPFEIRFKNNTYQPVQVKLSLDGTDILTGSQANTNVTKDMWYVKAYNSLTLKAWPETSHGGSQFVFTSVDNSVAGHTHGDLSSRGIIAAAVYVEGHVVQNYWIMNDHYNWGSNGTSIRGGCLGGTYSYSYNSASFGDCTKSCDSLSLSDSNTKSRSKSSDLVSVGAGQYTDQKISYVTGLTKPLLTETIRVRYLWWDDLKAKLQEHTVSEPHATGFPGDIKQNIMSIGNTPKVGQTNPIFRRVESEQIYSRF